MTRLINADDMIKSLMDRALYDDEGYPILDYEEKMSSVKSFVDSFPTVDAQPVKHGRWIGYPECLGYENVLDDSYIVCSVCKEPFNIIDNDTERFDYCPNCGAKMDGEQEKQNEKT